MNCAECEEWVQRRLDGEVVPDDGVAAHRAACAACAGLHAAMGRLEAGLRLLRSPVPPPRLTDAVVAAVLSERRTLRRRQAITWVAAVAAALALAFFLGRHSGERQIATPSDVPAPDTMVRKQLVPPTTPRQKLNPQIDEAGQALASLVTRTASEAVGQGRLLFPESMDTSRPSVETWPQSLEPPVKSLVDAGQGVSAGLEPVTSSARRAVSLFLRDVPPMTSGVQ